MCHGNTKISIFTNLMPTFNGTPVNLLSIGTKTKHNESPKVNIKQDRAHFLHRGIYWGNLERNGHSLLNIHFRCGVVLWFFSFWSQLHSGTIKSCHWVSENWFFWHFSVSKQASVTQVGLKWYFFYFFKCPILWQCLMVPLWSWDKKLKKTIETPHLK